MVPLIPLAALGLAVLALRPKKDGAAGAGGQQALPPPKSDTITQTQPNTGLSVPGSGSQTGVAGGIAVLAATAVAATGAYQAGVKLDQAINPNSDGTSQAVAGVGLAATVTGVGAASALAIAFPGAAAAIFAALGGVAAAIPIIGAIILAAAVLAYTLTIVIQDLSRLGYGQAGAMNDFIKDFDALMDQCRRGLKTSHPDWSDIKVDRELQPFVEGYFARRNWSSYQNIMLKKSVQVSGLPPYAAAFPTNFQALQAYPNLPSGGKFPGTDVDITDDLRWHFTWFVDRGYVIGWSQTARDLGQTDYTGWWQRAVGSVQPDWVQAHCPPSEMISRVVTSADAKRQAAITKARQMDLATLPTPTQIVQAINAVPSTFTVKAYVPPSTYSPAPKYVVPGAPSFSATGGIGPNEAAARAATYTDTLEYADPIRGKFFTAGWIYGDFAMYREIGKACKGDVPTLRQALKDKKFEGVINDDGTLTYANCTFTWKDPQT